MCNSIRLILQFLLLYLIVAPILFFLLPLFFILESRTLSCKEAWVSVWSFYKEQFLQGGIFE